MGEMKPSILLPVLLLLFLADSSSAHPRLLALVKQQPIILTYHHGPLLKGNFDVTLIWYGHFTPAQRQVLADFVASFGHHIPKPSVDSWWSTTSLYKYPARHAPKWTNLRLVNQIVDSNYSLGLNLTRAHIAQLASLGGKKYSINVVLTAADVLVDNFCLNVCGSHGTSAVRGSRSRYAYIWVGNPATQCPGECAWPFAKAVMGPPTPPLIPPNGDAGIDGMAITLATLLAGTVTNPFDSGYFQGPPTFPLEAVSACTGIFGKGGFPGYPGQVLVDNKTGGSYNVNGANGRKFMVPAMWHPRRKQCVPPV